MSNKDDTKWAWDPDKHPGEQRNRRVRDRRRAPVRLGAKFGATLYTDIWKRIPIVKDLLP